MVKLLLKVRGWVYTGVKFLGGKIKVRKIKSITMKTVLTLRTSHAGIPALHKLPSGVARRYSGGTLCQCQALHAGIPECPSLRDTDKTAAEK